MDFTFASFFDSAVFCFFNRDRFSPLGLKQRFEFGDRLWVAGGDHILTQPAAFAPGAVLEVLAADNQERIID